MDVSVSVPGLLFAVALFMASFGPSLLPRGWIGEGVISGVSASIGYVVGLLFEIAANFVLELLGMKVQLTQTTTGGDWVLRILVLLGMVAVWWWSNRQHDRTAALVGMPDHPFWYDILATLLGVLTVFVVAAIAGGLIWLQSTLTHGLEVILPSVLAILLGIVLVIAIVGAVNIALVRQILEWLSRSADKANRVSPRGLGAPRSPLRSGSPGATQRWEDLGRRGQIFATFGPDDAAISRVMGGPAKEPIRVYGGLTSTVSAAVAAAVAELTRTGAFDRRNLLVVTSAGRGWVNEFTVQSFEYLTGGDCATVSVQYTHLASAIALVADTDTPRDAARQSLEAIQAELAFRPADERPALYVSGESLGAYGGHGAFDDVDDLLQRVAGAVWIGTPGFTHIWWRLTQSRQRGSPEITPVIDNGLHIRFASQASELTQDAYGRPLGEWKNPRIVYLQHASDPMVWWNRSLAYREPDWMRERAGRDVNPRLRWWPLVTWFQILMDQLASLETPAGHGHIYEDDLAAMWAGVLDRPDAPLGEIVASIRRSLAGLKRTVGTAGASA